MGNNFSSSNSYKKQFKFGLMNSNPIDNNFLGEYKNDYKIIQIMKKDFIFTIYGAKNLRKKENVCLKVYNKKRLKLGDYDYFMEQIKREEEIVSLCKCENIVNIYKKMETEDDIIFEIDAWDFTLADFIEKRGSHFATKIFLDIVSGFTKALKVLNAKGVMHRDIRPSNLFIIEDNSNHFHCKLGGFEHSIYIKDNISEPVGSYLYAAPEIIKNLQYDEKCDLWSLGITLHELLFQELPYGKNVTINMVKQAIYYEDNFYYKKSIYHEMNSLFEKLLTVNRKNRINFEQFFDYIKDFNIEEPNYRMEPNSFNFPSLKPSLPCLELYEGNNNSQYINDTFMNKVMAIIEGGHLPNIMDFPNGCINSEKEMKFNNIIYYDDNINFIKSIKKDSDILEKRTPGAFILCNCLKSMAIIREEILKQIRKDKRIIFNLITTGSACEKIMEFISEKEEFNNCIKNICIFCWNIQKYQNLKNKYPKIHDDIYKKLQDVINFINKNSDENIKPYPITKLITLKEYQDKYKERHLTIANFYGNMNYMVYKKYIKELEDLINEESQTHELKKNKNTLISGFAAFASNFKNKKIEEDEDIDKFNKLLIKEYSNDTFYKDLNKWLMSSKINYYESVAYFTARLMYSLNSYAIKNEKFFTEKNATIFRGIRIPYSCLLPYERAKGKIILLSNFTSTSQSKENALFFAGRKDSLELYKTNLLYSVLFIIKNKWENKWISNGINIQEESKYKKEKEILYQPFSFYLLTDIKIYNELRIADIYLETIGKTQILEEEIKKGKEIFYNKSENIIEVKG